jgi:oxalate decarboxylase
MDTKEFKTISRRDILKNSLLTGIAAAPFLSSLPIVSQAQAMKEGEKEEAFGPFKFRFEDSPKRILKDGWAREATIKQFPVSEGLAGVDMYLNPGAIRELHWHAIAAEWGYILDGDVRITTVDPEGSNDVADCHKGDIFFFPRGYGHSIQAMDKGCHFILIFDSGHFSEFGTFSITDWVSHTPLNVLAASTGMPASLFKGMPEKEKYMLTASAPGNMPVEPDAWDIDTPLSHKFRFSAMRPTQQVAAGEVRIASAAEFPISSTMTGVLERIKPGAVREMHWHPNADEWQYYISGKGRMTVFGSNGRAHTDDFNTTDVGYVPRGYGHYIENTGSEDLVVLIGLNSGKYEDISLSDWLATNKPALLASHFNGTVADWEKKPKQKLFFGFTK